MVWEIFLKRAGLSLKEGFRVNTDQRGVLSVLWRRTWHPTPVFLPGESHGQRSLVGCSPRGLKSGARLSD